MGIPTAAAVAVDIIFARYIFYHRITNDVFRANICVARAHTSCARA